MLICDDMLNRTGILMKYLSFFIVVWNRKRTCRLPSIIIKLHRSTKSRHPLQTGLRRRFHRWVELKARRVQLTLTSRFQRSHCTTNIRTSRKMAQHNLSSFSSPSSSIEPDIRLREAAVRWKIEVEMDFLSFDWWDTISRRFCRWAHLYLY